MSPSNDISALIGNTPLVNVVGLDTGLCQLFLKLENCNPGGSIKDRVGRSMIEAAERDGTLGPGSTLVEATSGNTGLGLALFAAQRGYRLILVLPDKIGHEKIHHLRSMGAELVMARSDVRSGYPEHYQNLARQIAARIPSAIFINQNNNPENPLAHETSTAPEIWSQCGGQLDAVVCGVGSGGTITGVSRFFARVAPHVEIVLADPVGSVIADFVDTGKVGSAGSWLIEGIGKDFVPEVADLSRVGHTFRISDAESMAATRELLRIEGILAGPSSGTLLVAALRYCQRQTKPKRVVSFVCDSGSKYLSKAYNDTWLAREGLSQRLHFGDLRDLIARRYADGIAVTVTPRHPLSVAHTRMRTYDLLQLPVLENSAIVGIIDESSLLSAVAEDRSRWALGVGQFMTRGLHVVPLSANVKSVQQLLSAGHVVTVADEAGFHGLITQMDLLNYLRRSPLAA